MKCDCATSYTLVLGQATSSDYKRAKRILDRGKHPTFIGRDLVIGHARNGGLLIFRFQDVDVAVAVVNTSVNSLLVLNVVPEHRSHGLGKVLIQFLKPTWVRSIDSAILFFNKVGYVSVGSMKKGRRFGTQIMVKRSLLTLSGRVIRILHPVPWNNARS